MRPVWRRRSLGSILEGHTPVPCDDAECLHDWLMDYPARFVALTDLGPSGRVSTVFVMYGEQPFDSRVYGGLLDGHGQRVATWDEAVEHHTALVATCLACLPVDTEPVAVIRPQGYCPQCLASGYGRVSRHRLEAITY
jgi:hypothetical protein